MAKNFPFFKFIATEWMTGNISYETLAAQGLFINICALYWQRDCELTLKDIVKRYKNPAELNDLKGNYFDFNESGKISIKFLDEQYAETRELSRSRSESGRKGAAAREDKPVVIEKKQQRRVTEPEKNESLIDYFIKDLPNSAEFERICMAINTPKETLLNNLAEFKKAANLNYPSMQKFAEHFKNWYLKQSKEIQLHNPSRTSVAFGVKKHGR